MSAHTDAAHGNPSAAIVLLGHGSRDPLWHEPMAAVAAHISALQPQLTVRCAYLELSSPDLLTACRELHALHCVEVQVLPLFLGMGRHVREDLPRLLDQISSELPALRLTLKPAVGADVRVVQLLAQIACECR